jgi:hypothetical protein
MWAVGLWRQGKLASPSLICLLSAGHHDLVPVPPYLKASDEEPRPDGTGITVAFPWLPFQGPKVSHIGDLPDSVPPQHVFAYLPGAP